MSDYMKGQASVETIMILMLIIILSTMALGPIIQTGKQINITAAARNATISHISATEQKIMLKEIQYIEEANKYKIIVKSKPIIPRNQQQALRDSITEEVGKTTSTSDKQNGLEIEFTT